MSPLNEEVHMPWIIPHLEHLFNNEPLQQLLDNFCADACDLTGFSRAILVSTAPNAEAVGIYNIPESVRNAVIENLKFTGSVSDLNPPESLVKQFQVKNTFISFIPEESESPLPKTILSKDFKTKGTWKSKDVLFLLLYSANGEYLGNLRLTEPSDFNRPNFNDSETVQTFNEIAIIGGRIIDYYLRCQHLRFSELIYMYSFDQLDHPLLLINDKGQVYRANYALNEICQKHQVKPSDLIKLIKAQNAKQWEMLIKMANSTNLHLVFKPLGAKNKLEFDIQAKPLIPNTNFASILDFKMLTEENKLKKGKDEPEFEEEKIEDWKTSEDQEKGIDQKVESVEEVSIPEKKPQKVEETLTTDQIDALIEISGNIAQYLSVVSGNIELMKMTLTNEAHLKLVDVMLVAVDKINQQLLKIKELDKPRMAKEKIGKEKKKITIKPQGILCVEDEPQILELLTAIVKQCNEEVLTAENGKEAWDLINQGKIPKMVISDVRMPLMTGFDLLKNIRDAGLEIPVILISGFWSEDTIQAAKRLGVTEFMPKPFPVGKLIEHIKSVSES